jgi:hypothetical protein
MKTLMSWWYFRCFRYQQAGRSLRGLSSNEVQHSSRRDLKVLPNQVIGASQSANAWLEFYTDCCCGCRFLSSFLTVRARHHRIRKSGPIISTNEHQLASTVSVYSDDQSGVFNSLMELRTPPYRVFGAKRQRLSAIPLIESPFLFSKLPLVPQCSGHPIVSDHASALVSLMGHETLRLIASIYNWALVS